MQMRQVPLCWVALEKEDDGVTNEKSTHSAPTSCNMSNSNSCRSDEEFDETAFQHVDIRDSADTHVSPRCVPTADIASSPLSRSNPFHLDSSNVTNIQHLAAVEERQLVENVIDASYAANIHLLSDCCGPVPPDAFDVAVAPKLNATTAEGSDAFRCDDPDGWRANEGKEALDAILKRYGSS